MVSSVYDPSLEVSIGIPTKNNAESIKRTFKQIAQQTYPPDRVIIVDDSDDRTWKIIEEVGETMNFRIDIYQQSTEGRGVGRARQDIYENFDEDVLVCLDTDHAVPDDWLETHIRFHAENPSYGILSNSSRPGFDEQVRDPKKSEFFGQSNCSLKREALDQVKGWDPWFPRGEDWDIRIRFWTAGVKSYAKHDIDAWRFDRDVAGDTLTWFRKKVTMSPSSVTFLRKYGFWYFRFHPIHVIGDTLSLLAILSLVLIPFVAVIEPVLAMVLLGPPIILSAAYMYYKGPRKRNCFGILLRDFTAVPVFFALGLSALNNLLRIDRNIDWNYGGFENKLR